MTKLSPVARAVMPLRNTAIERAEKEATKRVAQITTELEANGWDLEKTAPYPRMNAWSPNYMVAKLKHDIFSMIVRHRQGTRRLNDPDFVDIDPKLVERFIQEAKETAAAQYDAFIAKLEAKIGAHEAAKLTGNHVWGYSLLTVTMTDNTVQRWKTQQIVNISKLGKFFNQWPSRKIK